MADDTNPDLAAYEFKESFGQVQRLIDKAQGWRESAREAECHARNVMAEAKQIQANIAATMKHLSPYEVLVLANAYGRPTEGYRLGANGEVIPFKLVNQYELIERIAAEKAKAAPVVVSEGDGFDIPPLSIEGPPLHFEEECENNDGCPCHRHEAATARGPA